MRVLHVNNVANVPKELVDALDAIGVGAELYQPRTGVAAKGALGKLKLASQRAADIRALGARVRRDRFDLVHIHYAYFGVLGVLGRFPYWLHCHGTDVRRNLNHPFFGPPTRLSLSRATRVLFSTPDLEEIVQSVRPDGRYLPNPVDTARFTPAQSPPPKPKVLLLSRIEEIKGIGTAMAAARLLAKEGVHVTAVDWGPDAPKYYDQPGLTFVPKAGHAGFVDLLRDHTVAVGQLKLGILSMSELEAMACGLPVVCPFFYDRIYPEPAPVLQALSAEQVADRVLGVLASNGDCREIGLAGRDWVVAYHDRNRVAEQLLALYHGEGWSD